MLQLEHITPNLSLEGIEPSLDGNGAAFQLTAEAKRIDPALLFAPTTADRASNMDPAAPPDHRGL